MRSRRSGRGEQPSVQESRGPHISERTRQRGRINGRACVGCHQRKIRCDIVDTGSPCSNCSSHNRPRCTLYEKKRFRSPRRRGPVDIRPRQPEPSAACPSPSVGEPRDDDGEGSDDAGNIADLVDREDLRSAEIDFRGRLCFIGTGASNFNYLVRQSSLLPGDDSVLHYRSRQFHPKHTSHDAQHVPAEALARSSRDIEHRILTAYFDRVNRGWPIVEQDHFMALYESKDPRHEPSLTLLNAMLVVGAHVLAAGDASMKSRQQVFFRRAKLLMDHRLEQDRTTYVQAALLLTWYSDGLEEIIANAWYWIGIATRTALGHGMHRDSSKSKMNLPSKRLWARLWWLLVQFDTMASTTYGRLPALDIDESDVPELDASHFEGVPHAQVDFAIQHARLCCIISRTARKRWSLRSTSDSQIQATREADEALAKFTAQLPGHLQLCSPGTDVWRATLHLTYNNFVTLLHRPPPRNSALDPVSRACSDSSICSCATVSTASILDSLRHGQLLSGLWLYDIHSLFSALVYVGGELKAPNPLVSARAQHTLESLVASLRVLAYHWRFAQGLLSLFEQRALRMRQAAADDAPAGPNMTDRQQVSGEASHGPSFTLRPAPAQMGASAGQDVSLVEGAPASVQGESFPTLPSASPWSPAGHASFITATGAAAALRRPDNEGHLANGADDKSVFDQDFSFPDASSIDYFLMDLGGDSHELWP